jgi:polysaccharide pyruvyl transferase WcaK-like protein
MTNKNKKNNNKVTIGLIGPFGTGNLGDAAIQQSMLQNIRQSFNQVQVFGFSLNPQDTYARHGIRSFPLGRMAINGWIESDDTGSFAHKFLLVSDELRWSSSPIKRVIGKIFFSPLKEIIGIVRASRHLINMDYMIVSGGGQLDDYWGGAWHHPYTLLLWGVLCRLRNVKYLFVSVGAGPLDSSMSKRLVRWALSLASYRSYRDQDSKNFIERCGFFRRNDMVYPDLAFSLDISQIHCDDSQGQGKALTVGIGPMIYFKPGAWPQQDQEVYETYLKKLALFTAWLVQNNCNVLFFTGEAIADRPVITELKNILQQMGINPSSKQIIEEPINTVDDLMGQLARTDLVIGSRFHGVLLSLLINKPVIALSYHSKITELMKDAEQEQYCLSIDHFEVEELKMVFNQMVTNLPLVKDQIERRVLVYRKSLREQYEKVFQSEPVDDFPEPR